MVLKRALAACVAATALIAAALWYGAPAEPSAKEPGAAGHVARSPGPQPAASASGDSRSDGPRAPDLQAVRSLAGTEVPGEVVIDAGGSLTVTRSLRQMFDYFLTIQGEVEQEQIAGMLERHLQQDQIPGAVIAQVLELFRRYQLYLVAVGQIPTLAYARDNLEAARQAIESRSMLRRSMLGMVAADAFFGEEERQDQHALAQMTILMDSTLSPRQREARLRELRQTLPPDQAEEEDRMEQLMELSHDVEALKAAGADPQAIRNLRLKVVGPEATTRFEELDRETAEWDARVAAFRAERERTLGRPGLTAEQRNEAVQELIRSRFTPNEALRLPALDEIERQRRQ
jgi:lipase chaperone LimK